MHSPMPHGNTGGTIMNKTLLSAAICTALLAGTSAVFANTAAEAPKKPSALQMQLQPREYIKMKKVIYRSEDRLVIMHPVYRPDTDTLRIFRPVYKPLVDKIKIRNLMQR